MAGASESIGLETDPITVLSDDDDNPPLTNGKNQRDEGSKRTTGTRLEDSVVMSKPEMNSKEELVNIPGAGGGLMPRSKITNYDISNMIIKCTVCSKQLFHHSRAVKRHPHLDVVICKDCSEFYGDGNFSQDELGDKYCRWCAQGGKLNVCDFCTNAFCNECIRRNLGRSEVGRIKGIKWHCYVCSSKPLSGLVNFCKMIVQYNKSSPLSVREKFSHKNAHSSKKKVQRKLLSVNGGPTADAPSDGDVSSDWSAPKCWLNSHCERTLHCMSRLCRKTKKLQFKANDEKDSPLKVLQVADGFEKLLLRHMKHVKVMLNTLTADIDQKSKDDTVIAGNEASQSLLAGVKPSTKTKLTASTSTGKGSHKEDQASTSKKTVTKSVEGMSSSSSASRTEEIPPESSMSEDRAVEDEMSVSTIALEESPSVKDERLLDTTISDVNENLSMMDSDVCQDDINLDDVEPTVTFNDFENVFSDSSLDSVPLSKITPVTRHKSTKLASDTLLCDSTTEPVLDTTAEVNETVLETTTEASDSFFVTAREDVTEKESAESEKKDTDVVGELTKSVEDSKRFSDDDTSTKLSSETGNGAKEVESVSSDLQLRDAKPDAMDNSLAKQLLLNEYLGSSDSDAEKKKPKPQKSNKKETTKPRGCSSDSEVEQKKSKPQKSSKKETAKPSVLSSDSDVEPKKSKPQKSNKKEMAKPSGSSSKSESEQKKPKKGGKKKILKSSGSSNSDSSSLEDFDLTMEKRVKRKTPTKTKKEEPEMEKEAFQLSQDDKIQGTISVVLKKLNESDVEGYLSGSMPLPEAKNLKKDDLDKEIARLSKMPKINKKSESSKQKKKVPQKKSPVKRPILLSSDSSSSESSDLEISDNSLDSSLGYKKRNKGESINEAAKQALLTDDETTTTSDEGLDSSSSESEEKKDTGGKKRPSKVSKESSPSGSESGGGKKKKKKKTEKLLRAPINAPGDKKGKKCKEDDKQKKRRTKRVLTDSDESQKASKSDSSVQSASSSDDFEVSKPAKKRRRIKAVRDSSTEGDDKPKKKDKEENIPDTPSGKGRKNIRKLLDKEDLAAETRKATQAERERRKRIQERQKMFNQVTDFMDELGESVTRKLVLDVDQSSKEILVEVDQDLVTKLKPHQVDGVKFMFLSTVESVQQLKEEKTGSGCILAHCMGLGKTLQVITYVHTLLTNEHVQPFLKTCLVVSPYNTVLNWATEFDTWQDGLEDQVEVHELTNIKSNPLRADVLKHWRDTGGVLIIGYDKFRLLTNEKSKTVPKKLKAVFAEALLDPGPDIVVCDEGHILKNEKAAISKAMTQIRTKRRIVLTGTPLQNNLQEYHCMVQFVKPHLLGQRKEFLNRFLNPITNGQCADSTPQDVKLMKKRVHILHTLLEGCVQRCDYSAVTTFLPPKYEYVISVRLSEPQIKMYRHYLETMSSRGGVTTGTRGTGLFKDFNMLKLIWTHPYVLQLCKIRADLKASYDDEDSMEDFIDDDGTASASWSSSASDNEVTCLDDPKPSTSTGVGDDEVEVVNKWKTRTRGGKVKKATEEVEEEVEAIEKEVVEKSWWNEYIPVEELMKVELSGKMVLLFEILKQCEAVGDKLLVFTSSILTLNMIEELLAIEDSKKEEESKQVNTEEKKEGGEKEVKETLDHIEDRIGTWVSGIDYFRMDGTTSAEVRKRCTQKFNNPENERARLYLISTKAGSLGINLVGANRVIVMDASWNPTHDVQAIFRVFRFGQKKPVYIYRFLAQGTMEEKIYDRQVAKQSLACRVVDEQQIERHFNAADLAELYSFEPDSKSKRPTPLVPKDLLLAEMLMKQKDWIVSYHEHDSLLKKDMEEDLTEEERKVAWAEYEAEKEGRSLYTEASNVNITFNANMFTHNIDIQQMAAELRKKNPQLTAREVQQQLVVIISALLRHHQNRYHTTYNAIDEMSRKKQIIPNELKAQLGESFRMVHQLSQLQNLLKMQVNPQAGQRPAFVPPNRPQFTPQQQQQQRPTIITGNNYRQQFTGHNRPVLYSRNLPPRGIYQDNLTNIVTALKNRNVTAEPIVKQPAPATAAGPGIIIEEMDENTPSPAAAPTGNSTVVITEVD